MLRRSPTNLAYTKWKCDRFFFYYIKKYTCDIPQVAIQFTIFFTCVNRYLWISDETERQGLPVRLPVLA